MPRFSVILVHYQGATPHREFVRGVNSLMAQTNQDFELLAYHNGPLTDSSVHLPIPITCSDQYKDDWGYANRDRGLREATGDYIVHFNSDNVLYPDALERISATIDRPPQRVRGRALGWASGPVDREPVLMPRERVLTDVLGDGHPPVAPMGYEPWGEPS